MSTYDILKKETPNSALQKLLDGNKRFLNHQHSYRDFMQEVDETKEEQFPFAIILGCIDSRVPVEILFDQGIGDLFVTRTAGNIVNNDILGGMEYACKVVGSKLILVLGHESCGAVRAAYENVQMGYVSKIVKKINPSLEKIMSHINLKSTKDFKINAIAVENIKQTILKIRKKSPILRDLEKAGGIKIVGAFYHLQTGMVEIL